MHPQRRVTLATFAAIATATALWAPTTAAATPVAASQATSATQAGSRSFADWHTQTLDPDQNFRGVVGVSSTEAWVSGESLSGGPAKVFHTTDGGLSWQDVSPPGSTGLSFRDVEVAGGAVHVLAIGPGQDSRIYRTSDGGQTWTESFRNLDEAAFYDCMAFYPGGRDGLAASDPVDGKLRILATHDAGRTWSVLPNAGMPVSDNEYGFAASGNCLVTSGRSAFLITGGSRSRVLGSDDLGLTWTASESGIPTGDAAGGFAGDFATPRNGVAVGGDFADPTKLTNSAAYTTDGLTWRSGGDLTHVGEDVAFVRGTAIALSTGDYRGSTGTSVTTDGGASWTRVNEAGFHALDCLPDGTCWAAGSKGKVARN